MSKIITIEKHTLYTIKLVTNIVNCGIIFLKPNNFNRT